MKDPTKVKLDIHIQSSHESVNCNNIAKELRASFRVSNTSDNNQINQYEREVGRFGDVVAYVLVFGVFLFVVIEALPRVFNFATVAKTLTVVVDLQRSQSSF